MSIYTHIIVPAIRRESHIPEVYAWIPLEVLEPSVKISSFCRSHQCQLSQPNFWRKYQNRKKIRQMLRPYVMVTKKILSLPGISSLSPHPQIPLSCSHSCLRILIFLPSPGFYPDSCRSSELLYLSPFSLFYSILNSGTRVNSPKTSFVMCFLLSSLLLCFIFEAN